MAAVSTHLQESSIKIQDASDDEPYSPNTRDTTSPEYHEDEKTEERSIHSSSFSIHNVLKKERDSNSPENVFSTEKLLRNTPKFEDSRILERNFEDSRNSERNFEDSRNSERNFEDSRNSESVSPLNDDVSRTEISVDDDNSCSSDDTVLSVGNEAPVSFDSDKSQDNPGLTSFKHIQTHLNAISQLSQNVMNQPLLLRPSPITPNPLMFLNQPLLFQNPLINQVDLKTVPRMPVPQNLPNQFGLNFGFRKTQELRRTDENRRLYRPKSPENESGRDFINQNCLKFSIDNILKADFGRRITDPIKRKQKRYEAKVSPVKEVPVSKAEEARVPEIKAGGGSDKGAIDLSKSEDIRQNGCNIIVHKKHILCHDGETQGQCGFGFIIKSEYKNNREFKRKICRPLEKWEEELKETAGTDSINIATERETWHNLEEACTRIEILELNIM
ncbi:Homeobox protein engrailed [Operophtera brumata]|uniref:Homeobox protein engrailed n=1 Tax=Operophtera brumata TaxID=104452 RepID=A0A0L7LRW8_OPEBR|nr:Homeobox protein engrailed [Operophtera brumata]